MKKYNLRVDAVRFILALLVISIHTQPFININSNLELFVSQFLGRLAVPLFFSLSGYYLHQKIQRSENPDLVVKNNITKLIKIYLLTWILYIPIWFYQNRPINLISFVIDALWGGMHYHLWYFPALILGTIIVYTLSKFRNRNLAWYLVVILYIIGMGLNAYYPYLFNEMPHIYLSRNGLFFAPIFIMIGFYPIYRKLILGLIISLVLYGMEVAGLNTLGQLQDLSSMFLFLVPTVIFILPFILDDSGRVHQSEPFHQISLYMYIIHPVFIIFFEILKSRQILSISDPLIFILVTILSVLSAWLYVSYKTNKRNR